MSTAILVVEDDSQQRELICQLLQGAEYSTYAADSVEQAILLLKQQPDIALVFSDWKLGAGNGLQVLQYVRSQLSELGFVVATAYGSVSHAVEAIQAGADDYLIKPFALSELVARIQAILRRSQGSRKRQLQVGDLLYDLDTLHVSRAGQPLKLNPIGLKLLAVLMQKSPAVVRREALEEALWGDDCPDSDSLRSHIHQLRQVLDKPFATPLLHTLHGVGYRLAESANAV